MSSITTCSLVVPEQIESNLCLGIEAISAYDGEAKFITLSRHHDSITIDLEDIDALVQAIKAAKETLIK